MTALSGRWGVRRLVLGGVLALCLLIQAIASWVALAVVTAAEILASGDPYDGPLTVVGWLIVIVALPAVSTAVATVVALLLRLDPGVRRALRRHGGIPLIAAALGLVTTVVALATAAPAQEVLDGVAFSVRVPSPVLFWAGWIAIAFGLALATPPYRIRRSRPVGASGPVSDASRTLGA